LKKSKNWRSQILKFGDSTWVCDSSRVSGATDMGMPCAYPRISIPGSAHYGGGVAQGLARWLRDEERKVQYIFD
jgi:hypothetical protein